MQNLDFAPTLLAAAGLDVPAEMQGRSLLGIAKGRPAAQWREAVYYRYWMNRAHFNIPAHLGVRTKRHKLIYFYDNNIGPDGMTPVKGARSGVREPFWEFYDLQEDPREERNLYEDPARKARISELREVLNLMRRQYGDDRDGLQFVD